MQIVPLYPQRIECLEGISICGSTLARFARIDVLSLLTSYHQQELVSSLHPTHLAKDKIAILHSVKPFPYQEEH